MNLKYILVAATVLLLGTPAIAADDQPGIQTYGKLRIPPPPKETLPGNAAPAMAPQAERPEAVRTSIDNTATIVGSGNVTSKSAAVQRATSYIELKPGMDSAPMTMHIANNGFKWFRLLIGGQVVATEKSLGGKSERDLDLTGAIKSGTNQVLIQAAGAPGATLDWKVTTPAIAKIERVDPDEALVGTNIKLKGKNFSADASQDEVHIGKSKGQIVKAKTNELEVKIPTDAEPGDQNVSVKVNGVESNKVAIKVRGIPELSGTNLQGVPPGYPLVIFGKNFSKNPSENQVFFGDTPASVISGDTSHLTVTVPFVPYVAGHLPSAIRVQVGKVMSKNTVSVQVGPQMFTDPGLNTSGQDIPTFSPRELPRSGY